MVENGSPRMSEDSINSVSELDTLLSEAGRKETMLWELLHNHEWKLETVDLEADLGACLADETNFLKHISDGVSNKNSTGGMAPKQGVSNAEQGDELANRLKRMMERMFWEGVAEGLRASPPALSRLEGLLQEMGADIRAL